MTRLPDGDMVGLTRCMSIRDFDACVFWCAVEMGQGDAHVQCDRRDEHGCAWVEAWDHGLLLYVGRDGRRVLRERLSDGSFAVLHEVAS